MAKTYSYDLRKKIIEAIERDGLKKSEAAKIFHVSRNTIDLWIKRREETGDYKPLSNRPHRTKAKIKDWKKFEEFANKYGDKTQVEMALLWEEQISSRTISRGLQKIGFTRNSGETPRRRKTQGNAHQDKRATGIKNETNRNGVNLTAN